MSSLPEASGFKSLNPILLSRLTRLASLRLVDLNWCGGLIVAFQIVSSLPEASGFKSLTMS